MRQIDINYGFKNANDLTLVFLYIVHIYSIVLVAHPALTTSHKGQGSVVVEYHFHRPTGNMEYLNEHVVKECSEL